MTSEVAARLALLTLPGIGPARLRWLLTGGTASEVLQQLRAGRLPPVVDRAPAGVTARLVNGWTTQLRAIDPDQVLAENRQFGDHVIHPDDAGWPFADDPEPPSLLFARGQAELLAHRPLVAVIGTRRCSTIGRRVAIDLGRQLTEAGVGVVSGLASGIDGAAHQGVLAAGGWPLAVVATGLDVVYPAVNRELWDRVAKEGLMITESPRGTKPERWRFPARNRLIAGLASVIVVVESHATGGSLHTVSSAIERGRPVLAVPGSITSKASVGSNQLLVDGCAPVTGVDDILDVLGMVGPPPASAVAPGGDPSGSTGSALARAVLAQVSAGSVHIDDLVMGNRATIPEVLAAVQELVVAGSVVLDGSTVSLSQQPPL